MTQNHTTQNASPATQGQTKRISQKELERNESRQSLLESLKSGDEVYTVLRHVSSSGMLREIDVFVFRDNKPHYLSYHVARLLGWKLGRKGIRVQGCGMDMGFHLVYSLASVLFSGKRGGYKLSQRWL